MLTDTQKQKCQIAHSLSYIKSADSERDVQRHYDDVNVFFRIKKKRKIL